MTMTNRELIRKGDWAVSDLESTGGKLNPEQADRFIEKLINEPTILRQARVVTMSSPQRNINKLQFASRILKPAVSNTALSSGDRSQPTSSQVQLTTNEVIAEIRLPYDLIEDNVERGNIGTHMDVGGTPTSGGIKDTIMTLIAKRAALDLEELAILGDTGSGDTYLALVDGYLVQTTSNIVNMASATISKDMFRQVMQAMPDQYLRNRVGLMHYLSVDQEIAYRDSIGNRETTLGDAQIQGTAPVFGMGTPISPVALMPGANALLTNPMNLIMGIQRDIHIETDKDISARVYIIVLTARVDFKIEEEEAVVKVTNLG